MGTSVPPADELPAEPMRPRPHRVVSTTREHAEAVTLEIEPCSAADALAPPRPGQFNMMWVFGVGEVAISVSRIPVAETRGLPRVHHTIRAVGTVTQALNALMPGDVVGLRGPFGHGWDVDDAVGRDVVVVAGGVGLAPLRPVVDAILADRARYGHVVLIVGARRPRDFLFVPELDAWRHREDLDVMVTVDAPDDGWKGGVGVVTKWLRHLPVDPEHTTAFVCGPEVMMRFVARSLLDGGIDPETIRVSLERNMHCAVAECGHCQLGGLFVCREGPAIPWARVAPDLLVAQR